MLFARLFRVFLCCSSVPRGVFMFFCASFPGVFFVCRPRHRRSADPEIEDFTEKLQTAPCESRKEVYNKSNRGATSGIRVLESAER